MSSWPEGRKTGTFLARAKENFASRTNKIPRKGNRQAMEIATLIVVGMVIVTALVFVFTNGFHDTANAMATSIATGALKPKTAVIAAGTLNLIGAFLSTEVAKTISGGIINEQQVVIGPEFIFAGLVGAIIWNLLTWLVGLPSSSSHALFGGLVGAVIVGAGVEGVNFMAVLTKVLIPALVSPVVAGLAAWVAVRLILRIVRKMTENKIDSGVRHGQTVTACFGSDRLLRILGETFEEVRAGIASYRAGYRRHGLVGVAPSCSAPYPRVRHCRYGVAGIGFSIFPVQLLLIFSINNINHIKY